MEDYNARMIELTREAATMFNPSLAGVTTPTEGWLLWRIDHMIFVTLAYVAFVLYGRFSLRGTQEDDEEALKAKEPRWVRPIQLVYNPAQVVLCGWMMFIIVKACLNGNYRLACNDFDIYSSEQAFATWIFYLSKVFDFMDTIFIVAKSRRRQLTLLHTYHHTSIFVMAWINLVAGYNGDVYYPDLFNAFVHFVMYGYYFITSLKIKVPVVLKMSITLLQLIQFVTMMTHAIYLLQNNCAWPRVSTWIYLFYILSLFVLFVEFFVSSYCCKKNKKDEKDKGGKKDKKDK